MSKRWFVSSVSIGAATSARTVVDSRPTFAPSVTVLRTVAGGPPEDPRKLPGPRMQLLGPGDCIGFEPWGVVRTEPPPGDADAVPDYLAQIEFSDASLPWLLSTPPNRLPWLTLLVLRADEAHLQPGNPLPFVIAPATALPDLAESASWVHVEARVDEDLVPADAVRQDVRTNLDTVVSRLICPRRLTEQTDWLACVVPTTTAGVAAGSGSPMPADGTQPAWSPGQGGGVQLPVMHSWTFRTGMRRSSFEDLALKVSPTRASDVPGLGSRTIDVRHPWPHADLLAGAPAEVTVEVQGALRVPGTETPDEAWSDHEAMNRFRDEVRDRLDAPARRRIPDGGPLDRDDRAVAPPLYGSNHTGVQTVPADGGWIESLNTQVQFRVAAALGARYVQLEQEFLMARAWEQVGAVNEANRTLAVTELAAQSAQAAQDKHLQPMQSAALSQMATLMGENLLVGGEDPLTGVFARSGVPEGVGNTAFLRLTRRGGGLDRRVRRAAGAGADMSGGSVLALGLSGQQVVPARPATWLAATPEVTEGPLAPVQVQRDGATAFAAQTMLALLGGEESAFASRVAFSDATVGASLQAFTDTMSESMASSSRELARPVVLRGLRRLIVKEELTDLVAPTFGMAMGVDALAEQIRHETAPMGQQVERMQTLISADAMADRAATDERPLRPIMAHPVFGFPIGAELLSRWPEWGFPGLTTFPENTSTLLETNSGFIEALLVGLNQEFNRELRWREYPTDEAGTPFARFWPPGGAQPEYDEIARWAPGNALGEHDPNRGKDLVVLLVRADVLRRYPGTLVVAAKSDAGKVPREPPDGGPWQDPKFVLPVDERTTLYCFDLTAEQARQERWLFIMREPARGTQFGFDGGTDPPAFRTWPDLHWDLVPQANGFVVRNNGHVGPPDPSPPTPRPADFPSWTGSDPASFARIAFQQPFQLAFSPNELLPPA